MSKEFAIVLAIVFALLGGVFFVTKNNKDSSSNNNTTSTQATSNHVTGKTESKVNLTEFADFQCPACGQYYPILKQLKEEYKDKVAFQFRHFPLVQIHPNAFQAARASEAAAEQGKFWEYHDLLYENQQSWSSEKDPSTTFESYATQLNLDIPRFKTTLASEKTADIINGDVRAAQNLGATGTPTFVLNGKKIDSPKSVDEFKKILDEALAKN